MTDQELRDLIASIAVETKSLSIETKNLRDSQAKTDEQMRLTEEQMKRTDERLDKVAKLVGNISNNQGDIAEEFFYNSLKANQELAGIHYDYIDKNTTRTKGKIADEFDIVMVNGQDIAIIEVKYKAHEKDLEKLLNKKYPNFKELYPMYRDYNHHLALASFYISDDLKEEALEKGVMVLQRKGDIVETYTKKGEIK
jgi:Holliday junction resolvase-like predicted endonuclease